MSWLDRGLIASALMLISIAGLLLELRVRKLERGDK
jgi:hypothetical protein